MWRHGFVLAALSLVACNGTEVAQPADDTPEGMVLVYPTPDGTDQSAGRLHNEGLAWMLADLQSAKHQKGDAWSAADILPTVAKSEARFLKHHPELNQKVYYQMKNLKLTGTPLSVGPSEATAAQTVDVHSIEVASTLYWQKMAPEWNKLVGKNVFSASMVRRNALGRIVKADIAGAIAGIVMGIQGVIVGALAASVYEAVIIVLEQFSPPAFAGSAT